MLCCLGGGRARKVGIFPGKLAWAPDSAPTCGTVFELRDYDKDELLAGGIYAVPHYSLKDENLAIGPLSLWQTLRFCCVFEMVLKDPGEVTFFVDSQRPGARGARANAAVLLGAFLLWRRAWTLEQLGQVLRSEAEAAYPCSWATSRDVQAVMTVADCWLGLSLASQHRWIDTEALFKFPEGGSEYDAEAKVTQLCKKLRCAAMEYDASWLIPGKLLVSADPMSTVMDPNPLTCSLLVPKESATDQPAGQAPAPADPSHGGPDCAPEMVVGLAAGAPPDEEDDAGSCDTVDKDYGAEDRLPPQYQRMESPDKDFITWCRENDIKSWVRLNKHRERGLTEIGGSYEVSVPSTFGIRHLDLPMNDNNGAVPSAAAVRTMLRFAGADLDAGSMRPAEGAILVHCKGGLGRSMVLACCLTIFAYDIPGRAALAWSRIVRPGAINTRMQELFLANFSGRAALLQFLK